MRKHSAAETGKLGQIRDTKPKTGQMGVPGKLWFFRDTSLKNGTVPENPVRMVGYLITRKHGKIAKDSELKSTSKKT